MDGRTAFEAFKRVWLMGATFGVAAKAPQWELLSPRDVMAWNAVAAAVTPASEQRTIIELRDHIVRLMRTVAQKNRELADIQTAREGITALVLERNRVDNHFADLTAEIHRQRAGNAALEDKCNRLQRKLDGARADIKKAQDELHAMRSRPVRATVQTGSVRSIFVLNLSRDDIFRRKEDPIADASLAIDSPEQRAEVQRILDGPPLSDYMPYTGGAGQTVIRWPSRLYTDCE